MEKQVLTVDEMADVLRISRKTAYRLVSRTDFFPSFRIGKRVLVSAEGLRRWMEQGAAKNEGL